MIRKLWFRREGWFGRRQHSRKNGDEKRKEKKSTATLCDQDRRAASLLHPVRNEGLASCHGYSSLRDARKQGREEGREKLQ